MPLTGTRGDGAVLVHMTTSELGSVPMLDPSRDGTASVADCLAHSVWAFAGLPGDPVDLRPGITTHGTGRGQNVEFAFRPLRSGGYADEFHGPGNAF